MAILITRADLDAMIAGAIGYCEHCLDFAPGPIGLHGIRTVNFTFSEWIKRIIMKHFRYYKKKSNEKIRNDRK